MKKIDKDPEPTSLQPDTGFTMYGHHEDDERGFSEDDELAKMAQEVINNALEYANKPKRSLTESTTERTLAVVLRKSAELGIKPKQLDCTLGQALTSIIDDKPIGDIYLNQKMLDTKFRFITKDSPALSFEISNAFHAIVQYTKSNVLKHTSQSGVKKRNKRADQYARNIYEIIQKVKEETKVSTYRATVEALNDREVPTFKKGAKWQVSSLQNLEKRWKELGLTSPKPDQS